jgi:hypothetical protein
LLHPFDIGLCGLIDYALNLSPVDVQFASDGALAVASLVPGSYRVFQG